MTTDPATPRQDTSPGDDAKTGSSQGWLTALRNRLGLPSGQTLRETLEDALGSDAEGEGGFGQEERAMLVRMLRFGKLRVEDILVPRADIIAIDETESVGELLRLFEESGVSRIPVFRDTLDDPRGMIHIKDLFSWLIKESKVAGDAACDSLQPAIDIKGLGFFRSSAARKMLEMPIASSKVRRPALFVPPSMPVMNLLVRMQSSRIHMALVVDEYGGTDGLVTIEDLVEQIVGDIEDEHDEEEIAHIQQDARGGMLASARTPVEELEEALDVKLLKPGEEAEIDTIGGLIYALIGRIPVRGELIPHPVAGIEFEVLDADPRRIKKLKIHRSTSKAPENEAPEAG